jgi:hypothetical protein
MNSQEPLLDRASIRRLLAVGCPVPMEEDSPPVADLVVEVRKPERTVALDFPFSTEFFLDVRITNHSYGRLGIKRVKGCPPWRDEHLTWLGDPRRYMPERRAYRMESGREIPYKSVLNHRLREGELEPGESRKGMLLAWSMFTRIPMDYVHGETFAMRIALIDQYGRSHLSLIEVQVDRSATTRKAKVSRPFGEGLYGGRAQAPPMFNHTITRQPEQSQDGIENSDVWRRITEIVAAINLDSESDRNTNG